VPRSHLDGIDVDVRRLDEASVRSLVVRPFDGRRGEGSTATLS
jgi:hypothetical protein